MRWCPHVTVAAVIEREGRFLLVEEEAEGRRVLNQPAGHLDEGEPLAAAAAREALEETGWPFRPEAVVGIYRWRHPGNGRTFLRVAFAGSLDTDAPRRPLDAGILRTVWMRRDEIAAAADRLRSPLVLACIDDHLRGARHPLTLLRDIEG
ncbi:NUDIX hydrolase [Inmirania thermothiophila]|uniref:Phosphatase NudJ n=1 Tax=Inmirania thermothiophila TaxID=1750597 RepID=A0A3N1Y1E8_9GAMM|nr:NUDIX hydrolase [Inmirania thermothiophila]ROR32620.1 ADP-ribose pyrophosphatase YjhB (NUDIX family) [Inmirania thermothiophila]